ncbi:MAG: AAA family ATPase [Veillonella sp.]|uniref:ATP-binding protein n=1 Tax=Veillonella sp. TaxID=1926307 RepID=UPI0025D4FFFB|nr:AAA family ATPase [Veillonella sp.]MBS4914361.1 AAA family ATPase [Veillonella sp.]
MRIKEIHITEFGPYRDWSFTPSKEAVQMIFGPNESGKTSLLEALRFLLFGKKSKTYGYGTGYLLVEHDGVDYHIGRDEKKLDFYPIGGAPIAQEPADLWWHGLEKKTYDRIFAITVDELQGADVLTEVEVRARFFGAEGGERLSTAVKDIEKNSADLLVASAAGKRKINLLVEQLKQARKNIQELSKAEDSYVNYQQELTNLGTTEKELQERLKEWQDYGRDIDQVLRAWDVYKRAEHAKEKMNTFAVTELLEKKAFMELEDKLRECRNNMQLWSGKEAGLVPDNFAPDSLIGVFGQDIEDLYQEVSKWTQLQKECEEGRAYVKRVKDQLDISRTMHTAWRADAEMPSHVNWAEGEKLARDLRSAQDNYLNWQKRKPHEPEEIANSTVKQEESKLVKQEVSLETLTSNFEEKERIQMAKETLAKAPASGKALQGIAAVAILAGLAVAAMNPELYWLSAVLIVVGIAAGVYWYRTSHKNGTELSTLESREKRIDVVLKEVASEHGWSVPTTRDELDALKTQVKAARETLGQQNILLAKVHNYEQLLNAWLEEGQELEAVGNKAMESWQRWLPEGASRVLTDNHFFAMKQEYDTYMEDLGKYKEYEKILKDHEAQLQALETRCRELWEKLELNLPATPIEVRRVYNLLKAHRQNQVRWEQKESQRRSYHEEYEQWSRKEKALLLEQDEILQKTGVPTAAEYRQRLLVQDQYTQWKVVYEQSIDQLSLFAPTREQHDSLLRRLKSGNKTKWHSEAVRSESEISSLEKRLANLYEKRGQIQEALRTLSNDKALAAALQKEQQLEGELQDALTAWATQVLISHFMELAQADYEKDRQPEAIAKASEYLNIMTGGKYTLALTGDVANLQVVNKAGEGMTSDRWSSGLGDQVYLALRLSLVYVFSKRVESLPIILDDILLRFDEERQQGALDLLAHIGALGQVLIFTCQQTTAKKALAVKGIDVYDLSAKEAMKA